VLKNKFSLKDITVWIDNYNLFLIENKLIKKEKLRPVKQNIKNLFLSLINNPDNFTFDERYYIFINKYSKNSISASLVLAILKQTDEKELYLEIHEKTY
jgi:hypothetical protein